MCDTIVATPAYTKNGKMLLRKTATEVPTSRNFYNISRRRITTFKNADACAYLRCGAAGRTYL